jgi:hypothetical protein
MASRKRVAPATIEDASDSLADGVLEEVGAANVLSTMPDNEGETPAEMMKRIDKMRAKARLEKYRANLSDIEKRVAGHACCCGFEGCAKLHLRMGEHDMSRVGYVSFPPHPKGGDVKTGDSLNPFRYNRFKHYINSEKLNAANNAQEGNKKRARLGVALIHFHPALVAQWRTGDARSQHKKFPKKISEAVALQMGYSEDERLPPNYWSTKDMPEYCIVPSYPIDSLKAELAVLDAVKEDSDEVQKNLKKFKKYKREMKKAEKEGREPRMEEVTIAKAPSLNEFYQIHGKEFKVEEDLGSKTRNQLIAIIDAFKEREKFNANRTLSLELETAKLNGLQKKFETLHDAAHNTFMSRLSLTSDEWHRKNPEIANYLWGFKTWAECKQFVSTHFHIPTTVEFKSDHFDTPLTHFEELLLTKMHLRQNFDKRFLAPLWGKGETTIGRVINHNVNKDWGVAGQKRKRSRYGPTNADRIQAHPHPNYYGFHHSFPDFVPNEPQYDP